MKCTLVGSRYFGAMVFEALRKEGVDIARVVAPASDDRLAVAAQAAGVPLHVLTNPKTVPGDAIPEGTDLIVAAHTHARVSNEALARSKLGARFHRAINDHHRSIVAAIESRDEDAAGGEMNAHVEYLRPYYEKAWRDVRGRA